MTPHIGRLGIYVRDQDRALDFYTNKLGWQCLADVSDDSGYRWIEVAPPGAEAGATINKAEPGSDWEVNIGASGCILFVDDLDVSYEELSAKGVEFTEPPTEYPFGRISQFKDPDGNWFVMRAQRSMSDGAASS